MEDSVCDSDSPDGSKPTPAGPPPGGVRNPRLRIAGRSRRRCPCGARGGGVNPAGVEPSLRLAGGSQERMTTKAGDSERLVSGNPPAPPCGTQNKCTGRKPRRRLTAQAPESRPRRCLRVAAWAHMFHDGHREDSMERGTCRRRGAWWRAPSWRRRLGQAEPRSDPGYPSQHHPPWPRPLPPPRRGVAHGVAAGPGRAGAGWANAFRDCRRQDHDSNGFRRTRQLELWPCRFWFPTRSATGARYRHLFRRPDFTLLLAEPGGPPPGLARGGLTPGQHHSIRVAAAPSRGGRRQGSTITSLRHRLDQLSGAYIVNLLLGFLSVNFQIQRRETKKRRSLSHGTVD